MKTSAETSEYLIILTDKLWWKVTFQFIQVLNMKKIFSFMFLWSSTPLEESIVHYCTDHVYGKPAHQFGLYIKAIIRYTMIDYPVMQ